jgi:hypothetical protein
MADHCACVSSLSFLCLADPHAAVFPSTTATTRADPLFRLESGEVLLQVYDGSEAGGRWSQVSRQEVCGDLLQEAAIGTVPFSLWRCPACARARARAPSSYYLACAVVNDSMMHTVAFKVAMIEWAGLHSHSHSHSHSHWCKH